MNRVHPLRCVGTLSLAARQKLQHMLQHMLQLISYQVLSEKPIERNADGKIQSHRSRV